MIAFSYSAPNLKNPFENPNTQFVDATYYFDQNTKVHSLKLGKLKVIKIQNYYYKAQKGLTR